MIKIQTLIQVICRNKSLKTMEESLKARHNRFSTTIRRKARNFEMVKRPRNLVLKVNTKQYDGVERHWTAYVHICFTSKYYKNVSPQAVRNLWRLAVSRLEHDMCSKFSTMQRTTVLPINFLLRLQQLSTTFFNQRKIPPILTCVHVVL